MGLGNFLSSLASPPVSALQVADSQLPQGVANAPIDTSSIARVPRPRMSTLDTIGRLADVFARVGGADPLYQSTLDARQDRELALGDHSQQVRLRQQQLDAGDAGAAATQRGLLGEALGAISEDPAMIEHWPQVAQQIGIPPEKAAQVGQLLQSNPTIASTLAQSLGYKPGDKFSGQIVYGRDANGKVVAYQPGTNGKGRVLDLGTGVEALNPTELAATSRERIAGGKDRTTIQTARMRSGSANYAADRRLEGQKYTADHRPPGKGAAEPVTSETLSSAKTIVGDLRNAITRMGPLMNTAGQTNAGRVGSMLLRNTPGAAAILSPEANSAREDFNRLRTQSVKLLTPLITGAKVGGKEIDAAKELEIHLQAIASASDQPSALRAVKAYEDRVNQLIALKAAQQRQSARPAAPRGAPAAGKVLKYDPKTGTIG